MLTEEQKNKIIELFNFHDNLKSYVDIKYILKDTEINDVDELNECIQHSINEAEIIYYSNAMNYLKENDSSLKYSLELAEGYGYKPKDLSSEILATLLLQNDLNEELYTFINEVESEDIF